MTRNHILTTLTLPQFMDRVQRGMIGFDPFFEALERETQPSYPPYNIYRVGEDRFYVQLAVAGFQRDELEISVEGNTLIIRGKSEKQKLQDTIDGKEAHRDFIHKGIANREFEQRFTLEPLVKVVGAIHELGLLTVEMLRETPEEKKPKLIEIR